MRREQGQSAIERILDGIPDEIRFRPRRELEREVSPAKPVAPQPRQPKLFEETEAT